MNTEHRSATVDEAVRTELIRDLVERYPDVMPVLSEYGIDVCCGGSLTVTAAAEAHGHDPDEVVRRVSDVASGVSAA